MGYVYQHHGHEMSGWHAGCHHCSVDIHDGRRVFLDAGNNFGGILEMLAHLLEMCLHEFGMSGSKEGKMVLG